MKNLLLLLVLLSLLYACGRDTTKSHVVVKKDTATKKLAKALADITIGGSKNDSIAMVKVEALPEFKNMLKQYNKDNQDTSRHFSDMVVEEPSKGFNYYWVKVGENTPVNFFTFAHFYVSAKDFSVYYYDTVSDSTFTLSQWRKSGKDEWLNKK